MQHNNWGKDRDDLASLASKVITESYEAGEDKDAEYLAAHGELPESQADLDRHEASKSEGEECPLDIKSLDAQQYEDLLHSMFKLTHADAEETGDTAFEDTASYLRLAHEAYQGRRGN